VGLEDMVTAQADIKTSPGVDLVAAESVVWYIILRSITHLFSPLSSSSVFEQLVLLISAAVCGYGGYNGRRRVREATHVGTQRARYWGLERARR